MKKLITISMMSAAAFLSACNKNAIDNPNAPTMDQIIRNPTVSELNNLVTGTESAMRPDVDLYIETVSVVGRELYRFSGSESRWTGEILGLNDLPLDNQSFYVNRPWVYRYSAVRNATLLLEGTKNSTFLTTDAARNGYYAFAKTIVAYQLLLNLNLTYGNGIRTDVKDYRKLGPIVTKDKALEDIATLLDEANTQLADAEFLFELSGGFEGLDDPEGFRKFNRALAARVAAYRERWADVQTALAASFLDLQNEPQKGAYHVYAVASGDVRNPLYYPRNQNGEIRLVHPSYITDIAPGDDRIGKASLRTNAVTSGGLTGTHDFWLYRSDVDPVAIIRNEELVLLYAESKIQLNELNEGRDALNTVRTWHKLANYGEAMTKDALINEMLKQRRFSLFGEGHRWIDMRRYGRLQELPKDRAKDDVWEQMPLPLSEGNK
ncbi:RagB/SusD family nutrient uptake outer membrane protein [Chitinophaga horti]|uniref:RagB/SusD family nutrient uptake outer membrane protein n=1 Tax=Chitinophaga horti TaxID=2920382 RepID=A0ABY6J7I4_9BACT|nr:RagB/SusD family nutrient uptake outer membrane protein [Chitinophaga horti]UYQ95296.1 RagB/SusD family nutrient uptake outer membrane protein [Chitinophaga horti]